MKIVQTSNNLAVVDAMWETYRRKVSVATIQEFTDDNKIIKQTNTLLCLGGPEKDKIFEFIEELDVPDGLTKKVTIIDIKRNKSQTYNNCLEAEHNMVLLMN